MTDLAAGTWESPGGHLETGETLQEGAVREWTEEVGLELPPGQFVAQVDSLNGVYSTFIYEVESEADLDLSDRDQSLNSDGDYFEAVAWVDPAQFSQMPGLRPEMKAEAPRLQHALLASVVKDARGYELSPRSGMVSLDIPPSVLPSIPGGVTDPHITIVYLGKDVDDSLFAEVCAVVRAIANTTSGPLAGTLSGLGTFPASNSSDGMVPVFVNPDIPGIESLRAPLERFNASEHRDFNPHATLAYVDEGDPLPDPVPETPAVFTHLSVHRGDEVVRFPFRGCETPQDRFAANVMARLRDPSFLPLEKANPGQRRGPKGKWRPTGPVWEDFHQHTDEIVAHYVPLIEDALAEVLPPEIIEQALAVALGGMSKAAPSQNSQPQPQPQPLPPTQAAAIAGATAGLVAPAAAIAAGGASGIGAAAGAVVATAAHVARITAAVAILAAAVPALRRLRQILTDLYGDAILQGAHEAAEAANGEMPPSLGDYAAELPDSFWSTWEPGHGGGAAISAQTDLAHLLQERDKWVQEIASTQVKRIEAAISDAVTNDRSLSEARDAVDAIVHDTKRAQLVADTEFVRAYAEAALATYKASDVAELRWLAMPGACALCLENEAASPQPADAPNWPNGGLPVHPGERCALAPA